MIPKKALALLPTLPTFSASIARLQKAIDDEVGGVDVVVEVIMKDPALTANLLRLANSAWVGARREVADVRQAIALIGLLRVRDLAITAAFSRAMPKVLMGYGMSIEGLWRHSVAVGTLSEKLGRSLALSESAPLFVAGLLHDVGKLVVGTLLSEHEQDLVASLDEGRLTFIEAEQAQLGTDHGEIAEALGERWNLPQPVVAAGRWHHELSDPRASTYQSIVDVVHVGNVLSHMLGFGGDLGGLARSVDLGSVSRLGIHRRDMEVLASTHFEAVQASLSTLRLGAT
jgi:HD-like signal output (HDOD) protein